MSQELISHSPDLKRLRDEGYRIEIRKGHLLVHRVPYVNCKKEISFGTLVTPIGNMAGDRVGTPQEHTFHFAGEAPCDKEGNVIKGILNSSARKTLAEGIDVDHYFSAKPEGGNYKDYYDKVANYVHIISAPAESIDRSVSAKSNAVIETPEEESVFHYLDTNSTRAEIETISARLRGLKIAIVGLGGTGSYVLDLVAKTQVKEIHIFDGDTFLSHNAFRAPGAAAIEELREQTLKVTYHHRNYSRMHKGIVPHGYNVCASNVAELNGMNFVFVCIDDVEAKKVVVQKLLEFSIPFVDTGIGIEEVDGKLRGGLRSTSASVLRNDHIERRISFSEDGDDEYDKNIQIAEINALNAALAVIKWKKLSGFYHDLEKEHHTVYNIDCNQLVNDEKAVA